MSPQSYDRLQKAGIRPSQQRVAIMEFLLTHPTHPTIDDVYTSLVPAIPTLSKTTVYNTLRMFAERHAAQMITIDDHRVCYDGDIRPHVHFMCRECGRVFDLFDEPAPKMEGTRSVEGHRVDEAQLYYKGICRECAAKKRKD